MFSGAGHLLCDLDQIYLDTQQAVQLQAFGCFIERVGFRVLTVFTTVFAQCARTILGGSKVVLHSRTEWYSRIFSEGICCISEQGIRFLEALGVKVPENE